MKEKKLGVNAFLNAFRSGLSIVFPLITYPYIFRILHAEGIGKVNYSISIVNYFTLIAGLGISLYATREGARIRKDKTELNVFINQVFSLNVLSTCLAYAFLVLCLMFVPALKSYRTLIVILSATVGFTTLGVDWVNTIFEDYLYITVRSIVINLLSLLLLFIFVRDESDIYTYAFLTVFSNAVVCVMNWTYCRKYVKIRLTRRLNIKKHIKPMLTLFANAVATNVYVNIGVTMLGWMNGNYAVGIYEIAAKIYSVLKRVLAAIYSVAIPRISFHLGQQNYSEVKKIYTGIFSSLTLLLLPASVGLMSVSREVVLLMGGAEYLESVPVLQIMCIGLIWAIFGGLLGYCMLIPLGREKAIVRATMISATTNIVLNAVLIPIAGAKGAAIATAIAELIVVACNIFAFRDIKQYLNLQILLKDTRHACIGCVTIVLLERGVRVLKLGTFANLALIVPISVIAYGLELIFLKNEKAMGLLRKLSGK